MLRLKRVFGRAQPPAADDLLRQAIRERIEVSLSRSVDKAEGVSADHAEVLRLQEMLQAYEQTKPQPKRRLWPAVTLVAVIAVSVWLLLVLRVPTTEASFSLDLSSVAFRLGRPTTLGGRASSEDATEIALTQRLKADYVSVARVDSVFLNGPIDDWEAGGVDITADAAAPVSIRPLELPLGTRVRLKSLDGNGEFALELIHPTKPLSLTIDVRDSTQVTTEDLLAEGLEPSRISQQMILDAEPRSDGRGCARLSLLIRLHSSNNPSSKGDDEAAAEERGSTPFLPMLPIDALSFTEIRDTESAVVHSSTVLAGSLFLEEIGSGEVGLRRNEYLRVTLAPEGAQSTRSDLLGELLKVAIGLFSAKQARPPTDPRLTCQAGFEETFAGVAPAAISEMKLADAGIKLEVRGIVTDLSIGTPTFEKVLMPSFLERLQSWPELPLFWGAFGSVFGLGFAILGWLRGRR